MDEVAVLVNGKELLSTSLKKLNPREALAAQFGWTANNVSFYLRISKLIAPLGERLDNGEFGLTVAEKLTYLSEENQKKAEAALTETYCNFSGNRTDYLS
jgi:hypothetical protein